MKKYYNNNPEFGHEGIFEAASKRDVIKKYFAEHFDHWAFDEWLCNSNEEVDSESFVEKKKKEYESILIFSLSEIKIGFEAIEFKRSNPESFLRKFADPIESYRYDISISDAEDIAKEDPSLIWVEVE